LEFEEIEGKTMMKIIWYFGVRTQIVLD